MALVPIGHDTYIDTDDLDQPEYHYYCKAKNMKANDLQEKGIDADPFSTARRILLGRLTADEIERNPEYKWLAD